MSRKLIDLKGQRFGDLTVAARSESTTSGAPAPPVKCMHGVDFLATPSHCCVEAGSLTVVPPLELSDRVEREALDAAIEAGCRGLIDAETNGLCGESWPGPCDMCDCGLEGVTVAVASADDGARRDRARVAEVLRRAEPFLVAAAVDRALARAQSRIELGREAHFAEFGNEEPRACGEDWGWTHAAEVVASYRRELNGE